MRGGYFAILNKKSFFVSV